MHPNPSTNNILPIIFLLSNYPPIHQESIGLICCTILTGKCGVEFCWYYHNIPHNLPRAIIGIPAGCLLLVATVLMLADAYQISGITIKGLTTKSQKLIGQLKTNLKTCWPIEDPKGLLLKIIALVWEVNLI